MKAKYQIHYNAVIIVSDYYVVQQLYAKGWVCRSVHRQYKAFRPNVVLQFYGYEAWSLIVFSLIEQSFIIFTLRIKKFTCGCDTRVTLLQKFVTVFATFLYRACITCFPKGRNHVGSSTFILICNTSQVSFVRWGNQNWAFPTRATYIFYSIAILNTLCFQEEAKHNATFCYNENCLWLPDFL